MLKNIRNILRVQNIVAGRAKRAQ